MSLRTALFSLAVVAGSAFAAPAKLTSRSVVAHNGLVSVEPTAQETVVGKLIEKHLPHLRVINGCVPFPAVDPSGNTGEGLKPTGNPSEGCEWSRGQVYARAEYFDDKVAIMYAWYMPKTEPSRAANVSHPHNWNNAVVWLSDDTETASLVSMSISQGSSYEQSKSPPLDGDRPLLYYDSDSTSAHQLYYDTVEGYQGGAGLVDVPLVAWYDLPSQSQDALSTADFGQAADEVVPLTDDNVKAKLLVASGLASRA